MSRHDIRIRRERMSHGNIHRHKNYRELLNKHRKRSRMRIIQTVVLLIILLALTGISYFFISRAIEIEEDRQPESRIEVRESKTSFIACCS